MLYVYAKRGRMLDCVDKLLREDGALSAHRLEFSRHDDSSRCLRFMFALNKKFIDTSEAFQSNLGE